MLSVASVSHGRGVMFSLTEGHVRCEFCSGISAPTARPILMACCEIRAWPWIDVILRRASAYTFASAKRDGAAGVHFRATFVPKMTHQRHRSHALTSME